MNQKDNATYQRILDTCERLFSERGYTGVTLQEIAKALEMRHASLYYYAPKGKQQLYVEVMERSFKRHGEGIISAILAAGDDFRAQIYAIARWFATHPPIDLGRIVRSDLPAINADDGARLIEISLETLRMPIAAVIRNGIRKGVISVKDVDFAAMGLVALLQSVHNVPTRFLPTQETRIAAAQASADMLLDGWMVK